MGIGFAAVKSEIATQTARLEALNLQITPKNPSQRDLLYAVPEQLKEIEEEVRSIASRCRVFKDQFTTSITALWNICDSTEVCLNTRYVSLSETIQINAQFLSMPLEHSKTSSAQLQEQIHAIRTVYAAHESFRCLKASPELINTLAQAEKLLGLTFSSTSSSSSSRDSATEVG